MQRIVNADDFGREPNVTNAIVESFNKGYIDRTTIMVNMLDCERAVKLAKKNHFFDKIGIHLNLTEGKPLTDLIAELSSLTTDGEFDVKKFYKISRGRGFNTKEKNAIRFELKTQLEKYKSYGFPLMHIDSHHHVHLELGILRILLPIVKDFKSMRIGRNMMPSDFKSKLKLIYKKLFINRLVKANFEHTDFMGQYSDYQQFYCGKGSVEIMVHPEYHNGELCDVVDDEYIPFASYKL